MPCASQNYYTTPARMCAVLQWSHRKILYMWLAMARGDGLELCALTGQHTSLRMFVLLIQFMAWCNSHSYQTKLIHISRGKKTSIHFSGINPLLICRRNVKKVIRWGCHWCPYHAQDLIWPNEPTTFLLCRVLSLIFPFILPFLHMMEPKYSNSFPSTKCAFSLIIHCFWHLVFT